ncbi:hypothetical protein M8C21_017629, partial [Ambrosia artemisiifolia]
YVRILDTTLRDGEQSSGVTLTQKEKLDIARQLAKLGVDVIEAGFPAASESEVEVVRLIAQEVGNTTDNDIGGDHHVPVISCLARCTNKDIDMAWGAIKYAKYPRILMFIATSEIHMKYKLNMTKVEVLEKAKSMVHYAKALGCNDIQFCLEDATRSEREFLYEIIGQVIKAGATTIGIGDTVGYNLPGEYGQLIADIRANTPGVENVIISAHCHNDLGLANANTLQAASCGARQLEVTINGIGERAGNAALEEPEVFDGPAPKGTVWPNLDEPGRPEPHTHKSYKCFTIEKMNDFVCSRNSIKDHYKTVEEYTGMHVQPHKAIVGANAFAHQSGIHQDGVLKNKSTYEIMSPKDIGLHRSNGFGLTLGKLSGSHALKVKLSEVVYNAQLLIDPSSNQHFICCALNLGYDYDGKELNDIFSRFKSLAETKK